MSLPLLACSAPVDEPISRRTESTGTIRQPIIGGTASPADQDAVVLLGFMGGEMVTPLCTGTLIGHKVVLTARHCVANFDDQGVILSDAPASAFFVYPGTKAMATATDDIAGARSAARGAQLLVPATTTHVNADIALIVLDRAVPGLVATVRLDSPPKIGEELTLVGWGITEANTSPSERLQRRGATILGVGVAANTDLSDVGTAEFRLGEGTCFGDSGGPSFATKSMALLGIVSRGGNGLMERTAQTCIGNDVEDIHTSIAAFKPLVQQAFAAAGERPLLEPGSGSAAPPTPGTGPATATPDQGTQRPSGPVQLTTSSAGCSAAPSQHDSAPLVTPLGLVLAAALVAFRRAGRRVA